jgi:hypothetical protein
MMEKEKLAEIIYRQELQLFQYVQMLKRDGTMHKLFPEAWKELLEPYDHYPGGDIRKRYDDKHYVKKTLRFFRKYDSCLTHEVRPERTDNHGLHMILKAGIKYSKELISKL